MNGLCVHGGLLVLCADSAAWLGRAMCATAGALSMAAVVPQGRRGGENQGREL
jgi:hypothetical protein